MLIWCGSRMLNWGRSCCSSCTEASNYAGAGNACRPSTGTVLAFNTECAAMVAVGSWNSKLTQYKIIYLFTTTRMFFSKPFTRHCPLKLRFFSQSLLEVAVDFPLSNKRPMGTSGSITALLATVGKIRRLNALTTFLCRESTTKKVGVLEEAVCNVKTKLEVMVS